MSARFEDPRGKFLQRVTRLEARAHSPLNAPPVSTTAKRGSWLDSKVSAFFLGMLVLIVVRILVFHFPEFVFQARNFGFLPGMAGAYVIPLTAALLVAWFAGHFREEYWVPSLAGIGLALFFEQFIMLFFPDIWGVVYSPDFVAFVSEDAGSLRGWLDVAQAASLTPEELAVEPNLMGLSATAATQ